jgi:hypothetical protein
MKSSAYLAIITLTICCILSCHRIIIEPPPYHPADSARTINLTYHNTDTTLGSSFELIISEPGGQILLDSMYPYNTPILATFHTAKSVVDVSTIYYWSVSATYYAGVYRSVQPWKWSGFPGQSLPASPPNGVPSTLTYINAPSSDLTALQFASLPTAGSPNPGITPDNPNSRININYSGIVHDVAYLALPALGRYSYHAVTGTADTVDLSHMDTTYKVRYSMPSQYSLASSAILGFVDSTDLSKFLWIYNYYQTLPLGDAQYPPTGLTPIQKFWLEAQASSATNEFVSYRTFNEGPPAMVTLPITSTPIYILNSTTSDSFSVSFTQKPTICSSNWSAGNISVTVSSMPDSAQLHPVAFIQSLNSRMLQGKPLTPLTIQNFSYETIPGLDYNGYILHQTDPLQEKTQPYFASDLIYLKFF